MPARAHGRKSRIEIWTSMIGLAAEPGTEVDPMWCTPVSRSPSNGSGPARSAAPISPNRSGQPASYAAMSMVVTCVNVPLDDGRAIS